MLCPMTEDTRGLMSDSTSAEASAVPAVRLNDPRRVDSQRRRHSPHTTHASRGVCSFARQTSNKHKRGVSCRS